ncbi:MAG TPA: hypothetical protein VJG30_01290 [Candidatus Nanoarchaeia archaeon]|nr:hypothetical protein [Candidatus Nanoarchaeia archaeon]
MDKIELKKNRLDMEYTFEEQKAIILYTIGTITLITFLTAMIAQKYYIIASVGFLIILIISRIFYAKTRKRLYKILYDIENLSDS